ncbi:MAG: nucleotide exchange factor GrpE [candidate division WOR-3 bacterium]|uniref:Protein GrpE n=1 Tax=candidate division WOR-3 bacterium TaxID=2052148 RepID=A0A7C3EYZ5_UNCW3|nr:nucleotide exchange factor GrpE [candidate division WOR-3 bacterium]
MNPVEIQQPNSSGKKGPVTELVERVYELEVLAQKLKNDYLRALADFENYRKRMERDIESKKREGVERLICDLLSVLDNFERAISAGGNNVESVKQGVELIYRQLAAVLESYGLRSYSCAGEQFDPRRAEAVGFVECVAAEDNNRVLEELCRGYEISGRVVRPARVKVGKASEAGEKVRAEEQAPEIKPGESESNN